MARVFLTAVAFLLASINPGPSLAEAGSKMDKQIRMMFERFDRDGDGGISAEEFEDVHMIRFYTLDMDNDGEISREEFVFMRSMRGVSDRHAHQTFEQLDINDNIRLSVEEFDASRLTSFASLDQNKDGSLSPQEVIQVASAKFAGGS